MNDTYSNRERVVTYNKKSFLTPLGAVIALIGFFLPWINYSIGTQVQRFSGVNIGGITWIVFIAAAVILVAHFLWNSENRNNVSRPLIIIAAIVGLIGLIVRYMQFDNAGMQTMTAIRSVQFGLILTVIGFILAIVGALLSKNDAWDTVRTTNSAVRLKDQPSYSEEKRDL